MPLTSQVQDDVLIIHLDGAELANEAEVARVGKQLRELTNQVPQGQMLVDMSGLRSITSTVVGQLVLLKKKCTSENIELGIYSVGPKIMEVLKLVRLDTMVKIYHNKEQALHMLRRLNAPADAQQPTAEEFIASAEQGDAKAQFQLAKCFEAGAGVAADPKQAMEWYTKSAKQGFAEAQYALGMIYAYGMNVPQDYEKAMVWYYRAAEQNHVEAQYMVAMSFRFGLAGTQEDDLAVKWYEKAAAQGHQAAREALSEMQP